MCGRSISYFISTYQESSSIALSVADNHRLAELLRRLLERLAPHYRQLEW